jgi:hypothetical protein
MRTSLPVSLLLSVGLIACGGKTRTVTLARAAVG